MNSKIIFYETKPYNPIKSIPDAIEMVTNLSQRIDISASKIEFFQDVSKKKNQLDKLIAQHRNTYGDVMIVFPSLSSISEDRDRALSTLEKVLREHIFVGGWEPALQAAIMEATYRICDVEPRADMHFEQNEFLMTLIERDNMPLTITTGISAE